MQVMEVRAADKLDLVWVNKVDLLPQKHLDKLVANWIHRRSHLAQKRDVHGFHVERGSKTKSGRAELVLSVDERADANDFPSWLLGYRTHILRNGEFRPEVETRQASTVG